MTGNLPHIDTIVILMLEGRSFDHLLGHLSLDGGPLEGRLDGLRGTPIDGVLRDSRNETTCAGRVFFPFELRDGVMSGAPSDDRRSVAASLGRALPSGDRAMDGFVRAHFGVEGAQRGARPLPMGFLRAPDAPVTSFLARSYAICDRYFAPLPSGTAPNRLVAMSGHTLVPDTPPRLLPVHETVFDWMRERGVRYRVYHDGLSFFSLCPWMHDEVVSDRFRDASRLAEDILQEPDASFPQVIFVEPSYRDAPAQRDRPPTDNRAPSPMAAGERFLLGIYEALTSNPERFSRTLFVVTYASHGGFYDHVSPPRVRQEAAPGASFAPFETMGVRVPSIVVSPWVEPGTVFSSLLDHTSILQMLAERFDGGAPYSEAVLERARQGVGSLSAVLNRRAPRDRAPVPPRAPVRAGRKPSPLPEHGTSGERAFFLAARALCEHSPSRIHRAHPELWRALSLHELQ